MNDKLYRQQAEYLLGIARLHGPALAEWMDAHAERVTLDSHPLCEAGEMMSDSGIVTGWEGSQE